MKKQLGFLAVLVMTSLGFAHSDDYIVALSSKVIINNTTGYYTLSDGAIWKVYSFQPRWRTLSEWWNDKRLIPTSYECQPNDWFLGAQVQVLSKLGNMRVNDADADNREILSRCTNLLYNTATDKYLFGVPFRPESGIIEIYNDSFREGYNQGYSKGQLSRDVNAARQYELGYEAGYERGYQEALQESRNQTGLDPQ